MTEFILYSKKYGDQLVLVDDEDAHLFDVTWSVWGTARHHTLYVVGPNCKHPYRHKRLHRIIMNAPDGSVVDHINGNGLDNRKSNLRITTQGKNNRNARKRKNAKSSKYKGVHFAGASRGNKKWIAQIQINKKKKASYHLTELEAAAAYNELAKLYFGEFAVLNAL